MPAKLFVEKLVCKNYANVLQKTHTKLVKITYKINA